MRAPGFWKRDGHPLPRLLAWPLSLGWRAGTAVRNLAIPRGTANVPVICVGNLDLGGSGKTPAVHMLGDWFANHDIRPGVLSRGHGGSLSGRSPVRVDPGKHGAAEVGDEPLLHAARFPTVICANRVAGAGLLAGDCDVILMDDGFQNPGLARDLDLLVVDARDGFGNGAMVPAGPLREPLGQGLARADAIIAVGDELRDGRIHDSGLPVLRARLIPESTNLSGKVFGFCGIGRPEKFEQTLAADGRRVAGFRAFPDHHPFTEAEIARVLRDAKAAGATPVTTEKDAVRLPQSVRDSVAVLRVRLVPDSPDQLDSLLQPIAGRVRTP